MKNVLIQTKFEKQLWSAALKNLEDRNNQLRFNNFAYSVRELLRNVFDRIAPDEYVKNCSWYKESRNDKGEVVITRADRRSYAIRGGIPDEYLEEWGVADELTDTQKKVTMAIDLLNKYTHIEKKTFNLSEEEIGKFSQIVIDAIEDISKLVVKSREIIKDALNEQIINGINDSFDYNIIDEIDILSTHHEIESYIVTDFEVVEVGVDAIQLNAQGIVYVRLQYGSDSDLRKDIGYEMHEKYPFEVQVEAPIAKELKDFSIDDESLHVEVNTDSFYGQDDEDRYIDEQIEAEIAKAEAEAERK